MLDNLLGQSQFAPIEPSLTIDTQLAFPTGQINYQAREYTSSIIFAVRFIVGLTELLTEKGKIKR